VLDFDEGVCLQKPVGIVGAYGMVFGWQLDKRWNVSY